MSPSNIPSDPIYYRVYRDKDGQPVSVCMQSFDEADYDQSRFATKEQFPSEEAANEWIKRQFENWYPVAARFMQVYAPGEHGGANFLASLLQAVAGGHPPSEALKAAASCWRLPDPRLLEPVFPDKNTDTASPASRS